MNIKKIMLKKSVRPSFHSGSFYPNDNNEIKNMINYLERDIENNASNNNNRIFGGIVPHAGYVYSGRTAIYLYKSLFAQKNIKNIILFGPYHSDRSDDIVIPDYEKWSSPFGDIEVNKEIMNFFIQQFQKKNIDYRLDNNEKEHSLEVQMPLIKYFLPDVKIVPFISNNIELYEQISQIILENVDIMENAILFASSDLSHYYQESIARKFDNETIHHILNHDNDAILDDFINKNRMCGGLGVAILSYISGRLSLKSSLLNYSTSFDGNKFFNLNASQESVVGYCSIIFY